jgi:hypothetical protein
MKTKGILAEVIRVTSVGRHYGVARVAWAHHTHPGYGVSQRLRKKIERTFGWMKTIGSMRRRCCGSEACASECPCLAHALKRAVAILGFIFRSTGLPALPEYAEAITGPLLRSRRGVQHRPRGTSRSRQSLVSRPSR